MNQTNPTNGYQSALDSISRFFKKPFFSDYRTIAAIWLLLAVIAAVTKGGFDGNKMNNFLIFRQVYHHLVEFKSLYAYYPEEYTDHNLYGPFFSIIIAPFALMPKFAGLVSWLIFLAGGLYLAIIKLPLKHSAKILIFWFVTNEVLSAMQMGQFNIAIAALVTGTYAALRNGHTSWAALFVVIGTFTKLYGILALVLILFTPKKLKFAGWFVFWSAVAFVLPMAISSPEYIVSQYVEWAQTIIDKNAINVEVGFNTASNYYQNISVLGMTHRITQLEFSDIYILAPAALLFLLPFIRTRQWAAHGFQWGIVASALMCIILFSTSSESSGYIIAMLGVAIWYVSAPWKRSGTDTFLLIFALIIGSFGTSDLMPSAIKKGYIRPYSLKALPVAIIWLKLIWELTTRQYEIQRTHDAVKS